MSIVGNTVALTTPAVQSLLVSIFFYILLFNYCLFRGIDIFLFFFKGMPVYVYDESQGELSSFLHTALQQTLGFNPHITRDSKIACLFFVPIGMFPLSAFELSPIFEQNFNL